MNILGDTLMLKMSCVYQKFNNISKSCVIERCCACGIENTAPNQISSDFTCVSDMIKMYAIASSTQERKNSLSKKVIHLGIYI